MDCIFTLYKLLLFPWYQWSYAELHQMKVRFIYTKEHSLSA